MPARPDPTDWMWAQACDLLDQAERMHRRFFRLVPSARAQVVWEPPVDVFEGEGEVVVVVALPGVSGEHVEVTSDTGTLRIRAERPLPFAGSRAVVRQLEIPYGVFERRIPIAGTYTIESPQLTHGCLVVRLQRTER